MVAGDPQIPLRLRIDRRVGNVRRTRDEGGGAHEVPTGMRQRTAQQIARSFMEAALVRILAKDIATRA